MDFVHKKRRLEYKESCMCLTPPMFFLYTKIVSLSSAAQDFLLYTRKDSVFSAVPPPSPPSLKLHIPAEILHMQTLPGERAQYFCVAAVRNENCLLET